MTSTARPVRTRMPGGVEGERSGDLTAPIPIGRAAEKGFRQVRMRGGRLPQKIFHRSLLSILFESIILKSFRCFKNILSGGALQAVQCFL